MTKKILINTLICDRDNYLKVADIVFDEKFSEIIHRSPNSVLWKNISEPETWRKYLDALPDGQIPENIQVIDANGLFLMPGAIDPHVHFNTPGFEHRDDFEHGSRAAAFGGVTTVIDMPCTSDPPVTSKKNLETKRQALKGRSCIDHGFWGGISGTSFRDIDVNIRDLSDAGVVGFKTYLISGMAEFSALTLSQMLAAAEAVKKTGLPLAVHAEDRELVTSREEQFRNKGDNTWQAYCTSRDVLAEATAVAEMREICRQTDCRTHIVHLSSKRGLSLIRKGSEEDLPFSAETCPHYLNFIQEDFDRPEISAYLKTAPPVKMDIDRQSLWDGLRDDSLVFVTTDHAGCDPLKEKTSADFWQVYSGIPGVEHRVPFMFSEGFIKERLTLEQTIAHLSGNAARYFGLAAHKGSLAPGKDADFALISLWEEQTVGSSGMHSKGKYTPFEGMNFHAVVRETWLRGRQLVRDGQETGIDYNFGRWIRPG